MSKYGICESWKVDERQRRVMEYGEVYAKCQRPAIGEAVVVWEDADTWDVPVCAECAPDYRHIVKW